MSAPAPAPAPAAAPATTETSTVATAASSPAAASTTGSAGAPATTTVVAEQPRKKTLKEKILGEKMAADLEKQDPDGRKRKLFGAGLLGTIVLALVTTFLMTLLTFGGFVLGSYLFPMLACRMHGYNSQCMFNGWDEDHASVGEWFSEHLPNGFGGGMHNSGW